jgi:hypothetical protein
MSWAGTSSGGWAAGILAVVSACGAMSAQPSVKITSPEDGAVVYSGVDVPITVEASPANAFQTVAVIGPFPFNGTLDAPPYRFVVTIPPKTTPGSYLVTAEGLTAPGRSAGVSQISIQVEHMGVPRRLTGPELLAFRFTGETQELMVLAEFADADLYIGKSTHAQYTSENTGIATVNSEGWVKAVAPGTTAVRVEYQGASTDVKIVVLPPPRRK